MKTKAKGSTIYGSSPASPPEGKFTKTRNQAGGSSEGTYGPMPQPKAKAMAPEHQAAVTAALNFVQTAFQPPPQPKHKASEHKASVTAALNFAQTAFQPPPQPKHKASEHKASVTAALNFAQTAFQPPQQLKPKASKHPPAPASFQSTVMAARNLAQASVQPAPAPSSGGWRSVSINGNGTFTLPSIGTFSLPAPGQMKKIPLQGDTFFKIRQRADGSYEGKFGPDSQPAPQQSKAPERKPSTSSFFQPALTAARNLAQASVQPAPAPSSGGWSQVAINRNGTFTMPLIGTYPLPAPGETKKIPLQGDKFFKIRQRADGAYEGKSGPDAQTLPARLEDRKKDAGGWPQILVSPDGMIRVPGIAQPLYRPQPGKTDSVPFDAKTTFRFRQGEDGNVYGTFEANPPIQVPPGWRRIIADPDGMIRISGIPQPLYRPQMGQTDSIPLDEYTTFKFSQGVDGEVYGTFETRPPPGWQRLIESPDGMIRIPEVPVALYRPKPGQTDTLKLSPRTTLKFRQGADGHVYGTFETKPEKLSEGWTRYHASPDGKVRIPGVEQVFGMPGEGFTDHVWVNNRRRFELRLGEDGNIEGRFVQLAPKPKGGFLNFFWDVGEAVVGFVGDVIDFGQETLLPMANLVAPYIPGWAAPVAFLNGLSMGVDVLQGDAKPQQLLGVLAGPVGNALPPGWQNGAQLVNQVVTSGQNIQQGINNLDNNLLLGITQVAGGSAGVLNVVGNVTGNQGLVNTAQDLQRISNAGNQANQFIQNSGAAINAFAAGDVVGGVAAGTRAIGNAAGVASNFSQGEALELFNGIQSVSTSINRTAGVLSVAATAVQGALAEIDKGNVLGGLATLFGTGAQVTRTLVDAWASSDGRKFADELIHALEKGRILASVTSQSFAAIQSAVNSMRNGGDMLAAVRTIARALAAQAGALELISQGAFKQNLRNIRGVLETGGNALELKNLINSALQALKGGDIPTVLETLFGVGRQTDALLDQLNKGDTGPTVDKVLELHGLTKGPLGLKGVDLQQMKRSLVNKSPHQVMDKLLGLFIPEVDQDPGIGPRPGIDQLPGIKEQDLVYVESAPGEFGIQPIAVAPHVIGTWKSNGRPVRVKLSDGTEEVIVYDPAGGSRRYPDKLITTLPISTQVFESTIPHFRRDNLEAGAKAQLARYTRADPDNPKGRLIVNYRDLGVMLLDIASWKDMTNLEKAYLWSKVADLRRNHYTVVNEYVDDAVIDSHPGRELNTASHIVLSFQDWHHGSLVNLPADEARARILAHESRVRGIGVGINLNPGDTEASLRIVETLRAFTHGGFSAFARMWNFSFVTQEK